jgi:hypothetical protein
LSIDLGNTLTFANVFREHGGLAAQAASVTAEIRRLDASGAIVSTPITLPTPIPPVVPPAPPVAPPDESFVGPYEPTPQPPTASPQPGEIVDSITSPNEQETVETPELAEPIDPDFSIVDINEIVRLPVAGGLLENWWTLGAFPLDGRVVSLGGEQWLNFAAFEVDLVSGEFVDLADVAGARAMLYLASGDGVAHDAMSIATTAISRSQSIDEVSDQIPEPSACVLAELAALAMRYRRTL